MVSDVFQTYSSEKDTEIPKNALKDLITADEQKENGKVYDKKPFKLRLEAGLYYFELKSLQFV